jgi:putative protein-disulfide isomerase
MMTIEVRYYTDPVCTWSWGAEPTLRRLSWEFGHSLRWRPVMGGLARVYGPDYHDEEGSIGSGPDCFADLMAHWLDVAARTQMPSDPRLWTQNPISSSHPVCMAVKAAQEQGEQAGLTYLRRVREALMVERRKLDHVEALVAEAGPAGLNLDRFRIDLESNAIIEAFAADLEEVRDIPAEARVGGNTRTTEGRERVAFPSALFVGADGESVGVWGWRPYEEYRKAAITAGAAPTQDRTPAPMEAIQRFGRCATREIEELTGRPMPVVEAELWGLARDWRLKPVPALTGTLWELP